MGKENLVNTKIFPNYFLKLAKSILKTGATTEHVLALC